MLLSMAKKGHPLRIKAIYRGRKLQARLSAMGLVPGMRIEVISNNQRGPLVVKVMESRIILARGMAQKIMVDYVFFRLNVRRG